MLSPLMHHKPTSSLAGERGSSSSLLFPQAPSPHLSPRMDRQRSRSNEEMNLAGLPDALSSSVSITAMEETVMENVETVLSPFAKLTKGIQNLGASLGPSSNVKKTEEPEAVATEVSDIADCIVEANLELDEYTLKVQNSSSRTNFLLL